MYKSINSEVNVLSYYFSRGTMRSFPKRVEFDGGQLDFVEGLRCLVKKGQEYVQIFNMTDGQRQYRIQFQPEQRLWTLLSMKS